MAFCYSTFAACFKGDMDRKQKQAFSKPEMAISMIDIVLDGGGLFFESDAQRLRFDKAWMLLWKMLSGQMMNWGD